MGPIGYSILALISPHTRQPAPASADLAGSSDQPATVAVCRSGGFAGTMKVGQLDLNADPEARSDIY